MKFPGWFCYKKNLLAVMLVVTLFCDSARTVFFDLLLLMPNTAEAAVVVIEGTPNTTASVHTVIGSSLVFLDDQIGYKFFRYGASPNNGACVYRKTTDGGATWGSYVPFDTQSDCIGISVWYDRWTPGDTGDYIHIATIDTSVDEIFYNRLDTTTDTLLLSTSVSASLGIATVYSAGTNKPSITKATDGKIYVNVDDSNGTVLRSCAASCDLSASWANVGTPPQGNANSYSQLQPMASGNVMLINRSTSNVIRSSIWNGSTWSSFSTVDASAVRNTTYTVGMSSVINIDNDDIYIVYVADNNDFVNPDHDIRAAKYSGGSWSAATSVIDNDPTRGLLEVAIARDRNSGDLYAAYTARTTIGDNTTANVYYSYSTDDMATWGTEQGPVNTTPGNFFGFDMNMMSFERLYATWFDSTTAVRDIFGETIADIGPVVQLSASGTQLNEVRGGITDTYLGGTFALEAVATRTVSSVVITESGTIQAQNNLKNIKLFYDTDTSAPYDCASESYNGSETQFGAVVSGGFSGADGVAAFTASPVSVTPSKSLCFYAVMDILPTAQNGNTIELSVVNPETDIVISGSDPVFPALEISLPGTTTIVDPELTQFGYHWRLDNGSEVTASSATAGVENTPLTALQIGTPRRLRIGIANQGSTSSLPSVFGMEYGVAAPTCNDVSSWDTVGATGAVWDLYNSSNLTDGNDTTDISVVSGGITNLSTTTLLTANGGVRDVSTSTGSLVLDIDKFFEAEFSIVASTSASEGATYCFRMTKNTEALANYLYYPQATVAADVAVQTTGSQIATTIVGDTNVYAGGLFRIVENSSIRNVTSITVSETGTVDGLTGISNLKLLYDFDTSAPYNCASESYSGSESQFGSTSVNGFSDIGETSVFTDSVSISTTSALCLYVVYDVTSLAQNGETIDLEITSPNSDVVVSGAASVGPSTPINISGLTTIQGGILNQLSYHWRNDDGNETGATSATLGSKDTPLNDFAQSAAIRLRLSVTNTGSVSSVATRFRLEYAPKISTCSAATVWTDVGQSNDGWNMKDSTFLTNGANTTDISEGSGGVTNGSGSFISSNGGVSDTLSSSATNTITANDYLDLEYSITATTFTAYDTTYCFRVSANGTPLLNYSQYAELTTTPKRDFKIQRGSVQVSGTATTVFAGVQYEAPASTSRAFVRITNSNYTGAGHDTGVTSAQNSDDVTAYISNPGNIGTSFTITRPPAATANTRVDWEIIEFIGKAGTDNDMVVHSVNTVNIGNSSLIATGTSVSGVTDNSKVVVFVTGVSNRNASRNFYAGQVTTEWDNTTQSPVIKRGATGSSIIDVSYAVVEFVGQNWQVQRVEHSYSAAGVIENETITPINSLANAFIHAQKRMGATTNVVHFGHEVWFPSIGVVNFRLETGASVAVEQTSVAWIVENLQTGIGEMNVQRSDGFTSGGSGPLSLSIILPTPLGAINNVSIMANTRAAGANTTYPRPLAGFTITSTTTYQIWRSNTGTALTYRVELVEWPVADLVFRQNYYRFYTDNNELTPTDPWPPGPTNLGENTSITIADEPLGVGDKVRIRMSLLTVNASLPAGLIDFKLQYGLRSSTCSAISGGSWVDVGAAGSGSVWRGYSATGTSDGTPLSIDPPTGGDLLISLSDRAGLLVHENPSAANPYAVDEGEEVEYDWYLEHNGANPQSTYCFRVVRTDDSPLSKYNNYPQIRTAGFTPVIHNWRWYNDINTETPTSSLAAENVSPINIANNDTLALRVSVYEKRNVQGEDIKFKLQYSEDSSFLNPIDVVATSSCAEHSIWCYVEGATPDNTLISTSIISDSDSCVSSTGFGCGRHNSSPNPQIGHVHYAGKTQEYSFSIKHVAARVNAVYYFRLYDVTNGSPVNIDSGYTYPSLVTEGASLNLSVIGLPSGTTTAGLATNVSTTPGAVSFGDMLFNTDYVGAHRIQVETNATEGYQVLQFARQQLLNSQGASVPSISGTNATPQGWSVGCNASSTGCVGYHTTDATLQNGSTRFAPSDTYSGLDTTPHEIMYSSIPTTDTHDIVYRIKVNELQPAGLYETEIVYLAIPSY